MLCRLAPSLTVPAANMARSDSAIPFNSDRYENFFKMAHTPLPNDRVMMLHTIIKPSDKDFAERGLPLMMNRIIRGCPRLFMLTIHRAGVRTPKEARANPVAAIDSCPFAER
ncbi:hypothetical protein CaCOL14_013170 [Colletotrichum acutatum]